MEKPIESEVKIAASLDWRTKGVITPIYSSNQQAKDAAIATVGRYSQSYFK
jgi:hypothetical protein